MMSMKNTDNRRRDKFAWALSRLVGGAFLAFVACSTWAQAAGDVAPVRSPFLDWVLFLAVFVAIWFIFYMGVYPLLLRYYRPDDCKFLFWSLVLLYSLAWLHLSLYVIFSYGFFYTWLKWTAVFLMALWMIWFAVLGMTRRA